MRLENPWASRRAPRRGRPPGSAGLLVVCALVAAVAVITSSVVAGDEVKRSPGGAASPTAGGSGPTLTPPTTPRPSPSIVGPGEPAVGATGPDASDRVLAGDRLRSGDSISTSTGAQRLAMQPDGDLVLVAAGTAVWNTGTGGHPGSSALLSSAGALVVVAPDGTQLWSNGVRSPGARLVVKPDGRLYEIDTAGGAVWSSRPPSVLASAPPYVNPDSPAAVAARRARLEGGVADAALLDKAAAQGSARWLSTADGVDTVADRVRAYAAAAAAAGQTPVFVTYAIPDRDCGSMSAGGFSADVYRAWSDAIASGLEGTRSVVLVEPDSLLHVYRCGDAAERFALLKRSATAYATAGAEVYLDAGTGNTFGHNAKQVDDIAARLRSAGVARVAGFVTNVSNFQTTAQERTYANKLSAVLGGARYIIDTSRNGNGPIKEAKAAPWCNPPGRALGEPPRATLDGAHVANLWVKTVGLSDGTCNGGPAAGRYWEQYLLGLAARARW